VHDDAENDAESRKRPNRRVEQQQRRQQHFPLTFLTTQPCALQFPLLPPRLAGWKRGAVDSVLVP
jgi:hypothetical protein